jgi:hypothetical protein
MITQQELDEAQRKEYYINREEVLNIIKTHFNDIHASLKIRSTYDQTVIGHLITVLEMDLKNDVKKVKVR